MIPKGDTTRVVLAVVGRGGASRESSRSYSTRWAKDIFTWKVMLLLLSCTNQPISTQGWQDACCGRTQVPLPGLIQQSSRYSMKHRAVSFSKMYARRLLASYQTAEVLYVATKQRSSYPSKSGNKRVTRNSLPPMITNEGVRTARVQQGVRKTRPNLIKKVRRKNLARASSEEWCHSGFHSQFCGNDQWPQDCGFQK